MSLNFIVLFGIVIVGCFAEKARFDSYRVYQVNIENVQQLEVLQAIENNPDGYKFWEAPVNVKTQVSLVVPPHKFGDFSELVENFKFEAKLHVENLQAQIDAEATVPRKEGFGWTSYHNLTEIYDFLDSLAKKYPGIVETIIGGTTFEGREIKGVKISYKKGNKGVFIESNIHAREWITSASVTWIVNELLTSTDEDVREIAENFDWYVFPVVNADGFVYTKTTNRLWRKTRSYTSTPHLCSGADPNRNFAWHFMEGGASSNPCSDTYAGKFAFSEIETKSLTDFYKKLDNISTYLAFHSYSQLLLIPFGHTTEHLENYDILEDIGIKATDKLSERYGTKYRVGSIAEIIYIASGGSIDWIKGVMGTPITYGYELRDTGKYGFLLPPDQIIPTAEETLDSIIVILREGKKYGYH